MSSRSLQLHTAAEIDRWPDPAWLIDHILPTGGFILLHGEPGAGKSFVALDWALSIATGAAWQGRDVKHGAVVYVYAEGQGGLKGRVRAWKQERGNADLPETIRFVPVPVQIHDATDVGMLISAISEALPDEPIAMVVIDTLARCFVGGDENGQKDTGQFVAGIDRIIAVTGATVVVVHHDARDSGRARGSTALPASANTVIGTTKKDGKDSGAYVSLSCTKQKDGAEPFGSIRLQLVARDVGVDADNHPITSCVLVSAKADPVAAAAATSLQPEHEQIVRALEEGEMSRRALFSHLGVAKSQRKTWDRRLADLVASGVVRKNGLEGAAMRLALAPGVTLPTAFPTACSARQEAPAAISADILAARKAA